MAIITGQQQNRSKIKEVKSEDDLRLDGAIKHHKRHQFLLDCVNWLAIILIYLFVFGIIIWMGLLGWHYIATGNWDAFERRGDILAVAVISYLISYLQSHGLRGKD